MRGSQWPWEHTSSSNPKTEEMTPWPQVILWVTPSLVVARVKPIDKVQGCLGGGGNHKMLVFTHTHVRMFILRGHW